MKLGEDNIGYTVDVTNESDEAAGPVSCPVCFQMVNAPLFISPTLERIWASLDGEWRPMSRTLRHLSSDPRRGYHWRRGRRQGREVLELGSPGFKVSLLPEVADHPLICVESFDRTRTVGIAGDDYQGVFNNNEPLLRCIHSDPEPIPTLGPGESARFTGRLYFAEGDHEECIAAYERRGGQG